MGGGACARERLMVIEGSACTPVSCHVCKRGLIEVLGPPGREHRACLGLHAASRGTPMCWAPAGAEGDGRCPGGSREESSLSSAGARQKLAPVSEDGGLGSFRFWKGSKLWVLGLFCKEKNSNSPACALSLPAVCVCVCVCARVHKPQEHTSVSPASF